MLIILKVLTMFKNKLKDNYTQIPNEVITDIRLSHGAVRVFLYLASKDSYWKFWRKDIKESLGIKKDDTIAKYLKELREIGWLTRHRNPKTKGYDYTLMDKLETPKREPETIKEQMIENTTSGFKLSKLGYKLNNYSFRYPINPKEPDYFPILSIKSNYSDEIDIEDVEVLITIDNTFISNKKTISTIWKYLYNNKKDSVIEHFLNVTNST